MISIELRTAIVLFVLVLLPPQATCETQILSMAADVPFDNVTNSMYRLADCVKFHGKEKGVSVSSTRIA